MCGRLSRRKHLKALWWAHEPPGRTDIAKGKKTKKKTERPFPCIDCEWFRCEWCSLLVCIPTAVTGSQGHPVCARMCVCVRRSGGRWRSGCVCIVWIIDMDVRMQESHQMKLLCLFAGATSFGRRDGEKSSEWESRRWFPLPPPPHLLFLCFCMWRRTKPRQPIIKAEHSATLEKASSSPQRGVIPRREINGSENRARDRAQRWAVLFARLIVSGGCHVPDAATPRLAIQRMSLLFGTTKCLNYRENCLAFAEEREGKKMILFCTMWVLSGSLRKISPCLCCHHKQEAETGQRTVSLKLKEPHQSLPSLAKGVIYHSSASNYSPLPFHL